MQRGLEAARWGSGCACPHPALGYVEPSAVGASLHNTGPGVAPASCLLEPRGAPWGLTPLGPTRGSSRELLFSACCL